MGRVGRAAGRVGTVEGIVGRVVEAWKVGRGDAEEKVGRTGVVGRVGMGAGVWRAEGEGERDAKNQCPGPRLPNYTVIEHSGDPRLVCYLRGGILGSYFYFICFLVS